MSQVQPGLCGNCQHARRLENARGSVYWLCRLAGQVPGLRPYPRLPRLDCAHFAPNAASVKIPDGNGVAGG